MWKQFVERMKFRIELDEFGLKGKWVEALPVQALPYATIRSLPDNPEDDSSFLDLLKQTIIDWNLEDPETGEKLPIPKEDENSILKLPAILVNHITDKLSNQEVVPKKS